METKDFKQDVWMKNLISKSSPDDLQDEFVVRVMKNIDRIPAYATEKKSFLQYIKPMLPWIFLGLLCFVVLYTSDILYFNFLPGKAYITNMLLPSLQAMKKFVSGRVASIGIIILVSGCFLFVLERLIGRRTSAHRNYMISFLSSIL